MYAWIVRHLPEGPKPEFSRPINYLRIVVITTTILGAISFFSVASPYIMPIIQNRNLWAAISLITILLFTSGHMFNHIRKVPYVSGDGKGGISYFAGGFSNQFGLETQIVAAMCKSLVGNICGIIGSQFQHYQMEWMLIGICRRCAIVRNYCPCLEGSANGGSKATAGCCYCVVGNYVWHVQLLDERLQS